MSATLTREDVRILNNLSSVDQTGNRRWVILIDGKWKRGMILANQHER